MDGENKGSKKDLEYLRNLLARVREYQTKVTEADDRRRDAEVALERARAKLNTAKAFYLMELERLGYREEQIRLPLEESTVFVGVSPKEACVEVLKNYGQMTLEQLEAELTKGGFVFSGSPKRTINMALLGRDDVERLPGGRFRYKKRVLPIDELEKVLKKKHKKS